MVPGTRFCTACGHEVAESPAARRVEERKVVTVLFADVAGSTELGEHLDPERLRHVLDIYFDTMRLEIEVEGGTVEKFIGDAVAAAFGVPVAHEDDPERALRAAFGMYRRLEEVNQRLSAEHGVQLQIRIGINTGEALATPDRDDGEAMVTGDVVNVAARLQGYAEPGGTVVSERTMRASRGFRFRELGPLDLKGKSSPVRAYAVEGESPLSPHRGVPGLQTPMVGRDRELLLLQTVFDRVMTERRPHLVTIYGEAGVGKSRMSAEFSSWVEDRGVGASILRGRCLPYGDGVAYWPLAEILKAHAGALDTDPPDLVLEKLRKVARELLTADVTPEPRRAAAALAFSIGVEDPEDPLDALTPMQVRKEAHAAWVLFFSALAEERPVVVEIEDIHWADPALLDLLEELAERTVGPVLYLCPARPELIDQRPGWGGGRRNASSVVLDPLSSGDAERLVQLLLQIDDLPPAELAKILERAEGNPFFLEEIVRRLIDEGMVVLEDGGWRATAGLGNIDIPDTVQGVLAARIDLLEPADKHAVQRAAVVGRVFWPDAISELMEEGESALPPSLDRLVGRELVLERLRSSMAGEREYMFKHVLTRDVAYESLPRRDRGVAHARIFGWIERFVGERRAEYSELLAYHAEAAHRLSNEAGPVDPVELERLRGAAFEVLLEACDGALRRWTLTKAASLAERALALSSEPLERVRALEVRGRIALNDYQGDLAWSSFRDAADLRLSHWPEDRRAIASICASAVDIPLRWPDTMTTVPQEDEVQHYLSAGFAHLDDEETSAGCRLLTARAFVPFAFAWMRPLGPDEVSVCMDAGERAADIALRLDRPELASAALDGANAAAMSGGLFGAGVPIVLRRVELSERIEDPWEKGDIFAVASWVHAMVGSYAEAIELAQRGRDVVQDEAAGVQLHNANWEALAAFGLGDWDRVVELHLEGLAILGERADTPPYVAMHLFGSAAFVASAREDADAETLLAILERYRWKEMGGSVIAGSWLAWILGRRGEYQMAWSVLDRTENAGSLLARPFQDAVRAVLLAESGRWDEVPAFLTDAREYAARAQIRALTPQLDRLDGRASLVHGETEEAIRLLTIASASFADLGAVWERACTQLWLTDAFRANGNGEHGALARSEAVPVVRRLRSIREIEQAQRL